MKKWRKKVCREFKRDWQLHLMLLLPVVYLIIFDYVPMYGIQIAFRDYTPMGGITGSEWVGLKWFEKFVTGHMFKKVFMNTLILSFYSLVAGFPLPIIFALFLNAVRSEKFKKTTQTISYIPHFISTTVFVGIINMVFSPVSGIYGNIFRAFGGNGYPVDFRTTAAAFRHLYIWSGQWQGIGWSSIIYIAALSAVSKELHEAAQIDGASRWKRIWYVDLPAIMPTVALLLIMRCGSLIAVGFDKVFLMQSPLNLDVSEVISTYIYKAGMNSFSNYSYGAAVGLFNTAINLTMLIIVNAITRKLTEGEVAMF